MVAWPMTMFKLILRYNFLIKKVRHFGGRNGLSFNLDKVWHHSHGFEVSNIFYALAWPDFQKIFSFWGIGHIKKIFRGGLDEKIRRKWPGLEIFVISSPHGTKSTKNKNDKVNKL